MNCFNCNKEMQPVFNGDGHDFEPNGGLHFSSSGNYGSRVFDPVTPSQPFLLVFICDDCMLEKKERVVVGQRLYIEPAYQYKPWDPNWDPGTLF